MAESVFPAFLRLSGRRVLVVGAGAVATGKLAALLEAGAEVTVVAPAGDVPVGVRFERRAFQPQDLDDVWLVVSAATPEVNQEVARLAQARRIFANVVDDTALASVYLGSVVRKGGLLLAISSHGQAPALVALLREALTELLPDDLHAWRERARALRATWRAQGLPFAARRPLLLQALNALYASREARGAQA